ncbi:phospholipase D-like domain-containing protein [Dokdonia ponticola]|uniref:Phospholipase D-like domain-containing protein n=1 Tax=Dokdonia ponticola TaxID=2041041 RepID=A0ABV9HUU1_9FLAO
MSFLTDEALAEEIYDTIYYAEKFILILSPFIQLDDYFKNEVFKTHLNNAQVQIIIGFGKNESNVSRSFKKQDIEYFTQFPNITIVYIPNLHAKYYGNENKAIVTSMNLIDYSFINNIEFGVMATKKLLTSNTFFETAQKTCFSVLEKDGYTIYVKRPKYKKKLLLGKDYVGSEIELDLILDISKGKDIQQIPLSSFEHEKYVNAAIKSERAGRDVSKEKDNSQKQNGHCIRCKTNIPLSIEKPLCNNCYKIWAKFGDSSYPENYCVSCGKNHNANFSKPACYSCYKTIN